MGVRVKPVCWGVFRGLAGRAAHANRAGVGAPTRRGGLVGRVGGVESLAVFRVLIVTALAGMVRVDGRVGPTVVSPWMATASIQGRTCGVSARPCRQLGPCTIPQQPSNPATQPDRTQGARAPERFSLYGR